MKKEILNDEMHAVVNQLVGEDKKAFRFLHTIFGFDFQKPFAIYFVEGSYTADSLLKLAGTDGAQNQQIAILTKSPQSAFRDWHFAALNNNGAFCIDSCDAYGIDHNLFNTFWTFWSKENLEEWSKRENIQTYIIVQNASYIIPKKSTEELDSIVRFKNVKIAIRAKEKTL